MTDEAITTGRVAALLGLSDAQARRILEARHVEPVGHTDNPHAPGGPSIRLWPASVVEELRDTPEVVDARARRRDHSPADELAQLVALLEPHAKPGERPVTTLRRVLRSVPNSKPITFGDLMQMTPPAQPKAKRDEGGTQYEFLARHYRKKNDPGER